MEQEIVITQLSEICFWDVDKEQFDLDKYPGHIIPRVLEYGTMNDWRLILSYYGLDKIVEVCKQLRTLDAVSLAFISTISHTNIEDYRCYRIRQSDITKTKGYREAMDDIKNGRIHHAKDVDDMFNQILG